METTGTGTADRDLTRGVGVIAAAFTGVLAAAAGVLGGPAEALGAIAGSAVMLANLAGLQWGVARLVRGLTGSLPGGRRALWIGASGVRLSLVALVVGVVAAQGWVGVRGLLASLMILPVAIVVAGLRAARAA